MPDSAGKRQRREVKAKKRLARDERRTARNERREERLAQAGGGHTRFEPEGDLPESDTDSGESRDLLESPRDEPVAEREPES
jgi:hypothetical protein